MEEKEPKKQLSFKPSKKNRWVIEALEREADKKKRNPNNLMELILVEYFENNRITQTTIHSCCGQNIQTGHAINCKNRL